MNYVYVTINDSIPLPNVNNTKGGRPMQRILLSAIENPSDSYTRGPGKGYSCHFCLSQSHNITTFTERTKWGHKLNALDIQSTAIEKVGFPA